MAKYWVNNRTNSNPNNNHEVHKEGCRYMPSDKTYLGEFLSCHGALAEARKHHRKVDGCAICCNECHTG